MAKATGDPISLPKALLLASEVSEGINQFLIDRVPQGAWRGKPPDGKGPSIAAIIAHRHTVRVMWLKAVAQGSKLLRQLDRTKVTPSQAERALDESRQALSGILKAALGGEGRLQGFRRDVAHFFAYLIAHDAHHRGQITMLARQLGHPLSQSALFGMWEWGRG